MSIELKPDISGLLRCPFCDDKGEQHYNAPGSQKYRIICNCGAAGEQRSTAQDAVISWNTRPNNDSYQSRTKMTLDLTEAINAYDQVKVLIPGYEWGKHTAIIIEAARNTLLTQSNSQENHRCNYHARGHPACPQCLAQYEEELRNDRR